MGRILVLSLLVLMLFCTSCSTDSAELSWTEETYGDISFMIHGWELSDTESTDYVDFYWTDDSEWTNNITISGDDFYGDEDDFYTQYDINFEEGLKAYAKESGQELIEIVKYEPWSNDSFEGRETWATLHNKELDIDVEYRQVIFFYNGVGYCLIYSGFDGEDFSDWVPFLDSVKAR